MEKYIYFIKQLYKRMIADDIFGLAAQLAYFFLLSLFPLLLFIMTLIGHLPIDEQSFIDLLATVAPEETMDLINENISRLVNEQNSGLLSISFIGTLWSASNGVNALTRAFNRAYEVEEDRTFIVSRLIAIVLTVAMVGIIVIAILLPVLGRMIGVYLFSFFGLSDDFVRIWGTLRWGMTSVVFFIVFLALYRLAPNERIKLKEVVGGALFATISWQLVSWGFSFYVDKIGDYSATYGSLGAVIVLMIWFYISGLIIMIGGIINVIIRDYRQHDHL
ncbi:MAG TPA: YihY/virulence factor BrkB family protein [Bacillota bacterium]|nr:YihY/virulence factor BrkB family protein [Bacillota bacterium]